MAKWRGKRVASTWVNPRYNPSQNANGYTRFDAKQYGAGLERLRGYSDAPMLWNQYAKLQPGQAGYDHFVGAQNILRDDLGVNDWTRASERQLFDAFDAQMRGAQLKNQRPKRKFGVGNLFKLALPAAAGFFTAGLAPAAWGAVGAGAAGGVAASGAGQILNGDFDPGGLLLGGVTGAAGGYASSKLFGGGTGIGAGGSAWDVVDDVPDTLNYGLGSGSSSIWNAPGIASGAGSAITGAGASTGGGSVGWKDALLGIAGDVAGDVIGGIIGGAGDKRAANEFERAAQQAQLIVNPQPYQGKGLYLDTNAAGQAELNPFGRQHRNRLDKLQDQTFNRTQFNRGAFRDRLLRAANRVNDKREQQNFNSLESRLFNRQGASTGTQRQIADFKSDIQDRRYRRAVDSERVADQFARARMGDFASAAGMSGDLDDRFLAQQGQSIKGAQFLAPFGINNPAVGAAGAFRAQNTEDFFRSLGDVIGNTVDTGINYFGSGGYRNIDTQPFEQTAASGFFDPSAVNFGDAFTSNYAGLGF